MHYVCRGTCGGVSDTAKNCEAESCPLHDYPLAPCGCEDGRHSEVFGEKGTPPDAGIEGGTTPR